MKLLLASAALAATLLASGCAHSVNTVSRAQPQATPNYVADLREYFPELDEAWARVTGRDEHDHVLLSAHSTGGLTLPLWAADRKPALAGMVLNSPWFDLQGSLFNRTIGTEILKQVGKRQPMRVIPRTVSGLNDTSGAPLASRS